MASRQFFLFSCILLAFPFSAKADENLVELVKKTKPAVVLIQTFDANNQPIGQGSGFFVNNKGHIVTNHHVLEGAYRATVKTSSGIEYPVEGIIAKNADADIVKLVVNIPDANIAFLNLSEIVPSEGQDIVVIGNPFGLESSVSTGVISAVRDIPDFGKILQITAPVSSGSSGSPVMNMKGEVIGIATFIVTQGQNLNFAVPSDKISAMVSEDKIIRLIDYTENSKEYSFDEYENEHLIPEKSTLYHNSQGHFSFSLPCEWVEISKDTIEAYLKALQEKFSPTSTPNRQYYDAAFQKISTTYFDYPYVMLQVDKTGRWPENEIKKLLSSDEWEKGMQQGVSTVEEQFSTLIQNSKVGQTIYDKQRNIILIKIESEVAGIGKIIWLTAIILNNYGSVNLHCYSTKDSFENDLPFFTQIIDSFRYDIGYGYNQFAKNIYAVKNGTSRRPLSIGLIVFICVAFATFVIVIIAIKSSGKSNNPPALLEPDVQSNRSVPSFQSTQRPILQTTDGQHEIGINKIESCRNCGRKIGKLEKIFLFKGNQVCYECSKQLKDFT